MQNKDIPVKWKTWDITHSILVLIGVVSYFIIDSVLPLCLLAAFSYILFIISNKEVFEKLKPFGGPANWVTIFRLLVLLLVGSFHTFIDTSTLGIIVIAIFLMDGLDGYLARRFKTSSEFGGILDGETDAFFVMLLSLIVYENGYAGIWILWAGLLRYIFVLVCYILWRGTKPEPVSYLRKTIAVIIMGALICPFLLPEAYYLPILIIGTILVTASFGRSFVFQFERGAS
ncbi:CDP-alcohol phosphatidyltransferase family protein [Fulvivirgaceae bacterium BMA10]|uniref:CDP-alcohol phosphatidyltransferase family protein n=1 Tax=Splendidivirga corallicola TaxID=3051826 RepID=A0ABT8KPI0_9BACT|nr:CDP-alcohol phosphatidyltransferase family protein [Fulvivirgaceae bacterium BMA10]